MGVDTRLNTTFTLPIPAQPGLLVILAPFAASQAMLTFAACLAQLGPLQVLDGGNRFNAYLVARALRQAGAPDMSLVLGRIHVARAFTCYQMTTMLENTVASPRPTLVIDLLDTFYDESAPLPERRRLAQQCVLRLRVLSQQAPLAVSLRPPPPPQADPTGLIDLICQSADLVLMHDGTSPSFSAQPVFQERLL